MMQRFDGAKRAIFGFELCKKTYPSGLRSCRQRQRLFIEEHKEFLRGFAHRCWQVLERVTLTAVCQLIIDGVHGLKGGEGSLLGRRS